MNWVRPLHRWALAPLMAFIRECAVSALNRMPENPGPAADALYLWVRLYFAIGPRGVRQELNLGTVPKWAESVFRKFADAGKE